MRTDAKTDVEYERDLARRRREHLEKVARRVAGACCQTQRCLHDACSECVGTGVKADGSACVHMLSCPCARCLPHTL